MSCKPFHSLHCRWRTHNYNVTRKCVEPQLWQIQITTKCFSKLRLLMGNRKTSLSGVISPGRRGEGAIAPSDPHQTPPLVGATAPYSSPRKAPQLSFLAFEESSRLPPCCSSIPTKRAEIILSEGRDAQPSKNQKESILFITLP